MYAFLKTVHVFSIIVWIGGMIFAHFFLRPSLSVLEPKDRMNLMHQTLGRFFGVVLIAAITAWISGALMMKVALSGGAASMAWDWSFMALLGSLMLLIFLHVRFALYQRMSRAVAAQDVALALSHLGQVRTWVSANLAIGVVIVLVVYLF